jgi:sec-independent protein translocase protein TatA
MIEDLFRPTHLIAILVVVLLLFGPSKLPQLGDTLGRTIRDFKKAVNGRGEDANQPAAAGRLEEKEAPQRQG